MTMSLIRMRLWASDEYIPLRSDEFIRHYMSGSDE